MRELLLLTALLVALLALDRATAPASERSSADVFRALVPEAEREGRVIAAVELKDPGGASYLHLRSRGRWRSREAFGAGVDEAALGRLVDLVLQSHGTLRTRDPAAGRDFGFASPGAVRIALCGRRVLDAEDGDRWFQADFAPGHEPGTSFARVAGDAAIWELDRDPTELFATHPSRRAPALPPLVETRLFDPPWLESTGGFASLRVEPANGEPFELRQGPAAAGAPGAGDAGLVWRDDTGAVALPFRIGGYLSFLSRARLDRVFDPRRAAEAEFEGRVVLRPQRGAERVLDLRRIDGGVLVRDAERALLGRVPETRAELFLPQRSDFGPERTENPWEAFLVPEAPPAPPRGR